MANALSDFIGGVQAGDAITSQQRQQRNQNMLTQLAPQVIAGDPAAYAQAAAVDPGAAQSYASAGDNLALKARGAAKYLQQALQSGNPNQINAARQTIKPFMDTLKPGTSYPLDMDPQQEMAGVEAFLAQTEQLDPAYKQGATGLGVQSTYIDDQGNRIAVLRNGTTRSLGGAQASNQIIDTGNGYYAVNKGTGAASPVVTSGQGGSAPTEADMQADIALANQMIAAGIPEAQVDAFLQARGQRAGSGAAGQQLVKAPAQITPYQQAQLAGQARDDARADAALDLQRQMAEDARATRNLATEQKSRQAQQAIDARQAALNNVNRGIERIRKALAAVNDTVTGSGPIAQYGTKWSEAGQELEAATGAIQNSMLALTRVPGIGSQSDLEARIANMIYPSINRDASVNANTLKNLEQFAADLSGTARQSDAEDRQAITSEAGQPAPAGSTSVDDLLSKYGAR